MYLKHFINRSVIPRTGEGKSPLYTFFSPQVCEWQGQSRWPSMAMRVRQCLNTVSFWKRNSLCGAQGREEVRKNIGRSHRLSASRTRCRQESTSQCKVDVNVATRRGTTTRERLLKRTRFPRETVTSPSLEYASIHLLQQMFIDLQGPGTRQGTADRLVSKTEAVVPLGKVNNY